MLEQGLVGVARTADDLDVPPVEYQLQQAVRVKFRVRVDVRVCLYVCTCVCGYVSVCICVFQ
jgi:hypothetical protein